MAKKGSGQQAKSRRANIRRASSGKRPASNTTRRAPKRRPAVRPSSSISPAVTALRGAVAGAVAVVADRLPWAPDEPDAIRLLEADHRRFEQLLKHGEQTSERAVKGRTELLDTLTAELNAHELIEEKVLYPALAQHPQARDIVLEGYEEHHVADLIVAELHGLAKDDEKWSAKFKVLKENIEHHIKEEEGEMFRTARGVLSREELQQLGVRMARMKREIRHPERK